MNRLTAFFKKLRLRQILTVFLAGVLLIASTACSGATTQGTNPDNPAVQAGGANNPYKGGGSSSANLKISTDPKVNNTKAKSERDQANLQINSLQLIAANSEILYPGADTPGGRVKKEAELPLKTTENTQEPKAGGLTQHDPDIGRRIETRVEKVQDAFKDASGFVKEKADEAGQRPENNPALRD